MKLITARSPAISKSHSEAPTRKLGKDKAPPARALRGPRDWPEVWVLGFIALHLPLALLMREARWLAGGHALGTLLFGLWLCFGRPSPLLTAQWIGYVAGAEVLWRMCGTPIPWQFSEYVISFVCGVLLLRSGGTKRAWLPLVYFGLLLPASVFPFIALSFPEARQALSFNLSGPLCLAICALWFSSLQMTAAAFERLVLAPLGPIAGVAFAGFWGLATTADVFTNNSNFIASGGYGPNQVSSLAGLGGLLALFIYLGEMRSRPFQIALAVLALWLLVQSALTFSRTGLYLFGASFGAAAIFLTQSRGRTLRLLLILVALGVCTCALLPWLNAFTGGKITERFSNTGLTGRVAIAELDLEVWSEHPVFGAGVGMSPLLRAELGDAHAAHTEYTRLLADHGILGAGALLVLLVMTAQAFLRARGPWAKAMVTALAVWAFLFMAVTAMRLAAPAFLLGLVQARFLEDHTASIRPARSNRKNGQPGAAGVCAARYATNFRPWSIRALEE